MGGVNTDEDYTQLIPGKAPEHPEHPSLYLYVVVAIATLGPIIFGYTLGFTSPTIADDCTASDASNFMNCELNMNSNVKSLFGSLVNIGALVAALMGGPFVDRFGRRTGMQVAAVMYVVGWVLITQVPAPKGTDPTSGGAVAMLLTARVLLGGGVGFVCCAVNLYFGEISPSQLRGGLGTIFQIGVTVGLLLVYGIGNVIHWRALAYGALGLSGVNLVASLFLLESPRWLLRRGQDPKAFASLRRLRSATTSVDEILNATRQEMRRGMDEEEGGLAALNEPTARKALVVGLGLMVVQQLSGINAVMFYSGSILQNVFPSSADANKASIGIQAIQVVMTVATAPLMDRAGRVPLLLSAAAGMVVCCSLLGVYFYSFADEAAYRMMALVSLYGYVASFSLGMGAIPWLLMGEIFPPSVKGTASSLATFLNWGLSFLVTQTVDNMKTGFSSGPKGYSGVFWTYGGVLLLGAVFIKLIVPETKGKTLEEIQLSLAGRARERSSTGSIQDEDP